MGRGRQKAKQTKVARKLKYFSPDTDLDALQRELASSAHHIDEDNEPDDEATDDDLYSKYADYADFEEEDDNPQLDEDFWTSPSSK